MSQNKLKLNISSIPLNGSSSSSSLKRKRPLKLEIPNVLSEIPVESAKRRRLAVGDCDGDGSVICSSGFGVGLYSVKGKKMIMEDAHKFLSCPIDKKGFFGVYDGHGGSMAAQFVAENLHANIKGMLGKNTGKEEAVREGYLKTDQDFLKQGVGSGACCVTALIEGKELIVSNVGDCRAVFSRNGVAEAITKDHRASEEEEKKRIENKGGYVEFHRGAWRVHGILSVSRSIGDAHLKDWVLAEPNTKILHLSPDMEYLVLASDGLWEHVGNQEAIDIVLRSCLVERKPELNANTEDVKNDEFGCLSTSPATKLLRVSLVKHKKGMQNSPIHRKRINHCKENVCHLRSENKSSPSKAQTISLLNQTKMKSGTSNQENGISQGTQSVNDFVSENESLPSKAQWILLLNQMKTKPQTPNQENGISQWKENVNDFGSENESPPPSKAQRISLLNQIKMKPQTPSHENRNNEKGVTSGELVAACKELVNLAVSRGSLDDITVMVIDVNHFKD